MEEKEIPRSNVMLISQLGKGEFGRQAYFCSVCMQLFLTFYFRVMKGIMTGVDGETVVAVKMLKGSHGSLKYFQKCMQYI